MTSNIDLARQTLGAVRGCGVVDFCVCSGSRNAPLLTVLAKTEGVRLYSFVDERSAAFFALGIAKRTGRPAAVVTTSGTAVAELLPAVIEAFYSRLPLVLATADRPARFRGTGAPQSIDQEKIFGAHAATSIEEWDGSSPLHLNVEFDEPLIDGPITGAEPLGVCVVEKTLNHRDIEIHFERPLILLGGLAPRHRARVREFASRAGAPVYAEPLSGLREDEELQPLLLSAGERMPARGDFDGVIRIGHIPTLRFWRDLEESRMHLPVINFSPAPFAGLTRGEVFPIESLPDGYQTAGDQALLAEDRTLRESIERLLDEEPQSEPAMLRALSRGLAARSRVYLGNSLPIREWDLVATRDPRDFEIEANRGANGIDGQLSTFFGWCEKGAENVAIVGDLTAIYDFNAPWVVPQLDARFQVFVINNGGGRIFERVPSLQNIDGPTRERIIDNAHALTFDAWASMWGIANRVTEVRPDLESTRRFWRKYDELWRA